MLAADEEQIDAGLTQNQNAQGANQPPTMGGVGNGDHASAMERLPQDFGGVQSAEYITLPRLQQAW